ncbi:alanine racemase [Desulfosarcina ovata]|uniref:Alanine racemase n=2 Tax=Desulfosarcina ovata TaxID=83564 RepID=A0A5K8AJD8_9BACT|nr:alanine racemase [Desulfosarcina ovata]BBO85667.1 alanine racemase 1 [Desulfosarcina ovata subsp. sediminis]BBO92708.1 alanine racemase 1 [Desulfosarcina ovata subsp. ovata]
MPARTLATIHLDHLRANYRQIQQHIKPARLIPVVKANAYGHGAVAVSNCLSDEGAPLLAVAQFQEAMELRDSGIQVPILIFGRLFPDELPAAIRAGFRITLFGEDDIRWIEALGGDRPAVVHVKVETGMGRVGVLPTRQAAFFDRLVHSRCCVWEGLYSHFATADEADKTYARQQLDNFNALINRLESKATRPPMVHMANSGAIIDLPESRFDACRSGIMLYGHYPSPETSKAIPLKQVMALTTVVAHIRRLPAGHNVSYGRRWQTGRETTVAVLPIGYADGVRRQMTGRLQVRIGSRAYPVVGTITMDQLMVDVGDDAVRVGDDVLIWGEASGSVIQVLDVAEAMGTIPYELTCGVSARVRRVVVDNGSDAPG